MYSIDLHAHTRFFHGWPGRPTPFDPIGANLLALYCRWQGLDGVATTNHDYYAEFDTVTAKPQLVPGIEISTTDGHALVVGPDPPERTTPGRLTPHEVVSLAHDAGCAAIIAHPYRRSTVSESGAMFDAVEINGKHPSDVEQVRELADRLDLPIVGGSDAHYPIEAGRAYTTIDADRLTPTSVVSAIKEGRVEPHVRHGSFHGAVRRAYWYVHHHLRKNATSP